MPTQTPYHTIHANPESTEGRPARRGGLARVCYNYDRATWN